MAYLAVWYLDGCPVCGSGLTERWEESGILLLCGGCDFTRSLPAGMSALEAAQVVRSCGLEERQLAS